VDTDGKCDLDDSGHNDRPLDVRLGASKLYGRGDSVATDYDTPRSVEGEEDQEQSLEALKARRAEAAADLGDDADPFEAELDLPGADLSAEELTVRVLPRQADEFTCKSCFLVHHRSQLADEKKMYCTDCAA
jgi:Domain of unknown function (DUF4193)